MCGFADAPRCGQWSPPNENRNLLIFSFRYMFKHEQSFHLLNNGERDGQRAGRSAGRGDRLSRERFITGQEMDRPGKCETLKIQNGYSDAI